MSDTIIEMEDAPEQKWKITFINANGVGNVSFVNVNSDEVSRIRAELTDNWRKFINIELDNDAGSEMVLRSNIMGFSVRRYQ